MRVFLEYLVAAFCTIAPRALAGTEAMLEEAELLRFRREAVAGSEAGARLPAMTRGRGADIHARHPGGSSLDDLSPGGTPPAM